MQHVLVFGPQGPHEDLRAVVELQPLLPFLGIGPHREPVVADALEFRLRIERRDRDADIERENPVRGRRAAD